MITVLMAVHNGTRFLSAAIRSILDQTHSDFEFLIIDDGSTEAVDEVVNGFHDQRIVFIKQRNIGLTRSLNRGIDLALGEFVARMDSDDICDKTRLEKQLSQISLNPRLDMVGSFFDIINENNAFIKAKVLVTDPLYRLWRLQFHNNYAHGSMLLRKSSVQRVGKYNAGLKYAQDYDLWSRLSNRENSLILPEDLYQYRLIDNSEQASVRNYDEQLDAAIMISNTSLRLSSNDLTDDELMHVRSVYWNFQLPAVSSKGLMLIPKLFEGFNKRYGLDAEQRATLWTTIEKDLVERYDRESYTNE